MTGSGVTWVVRCEVSGEKVSHAIRRKKVEGEWYGQSLQQQGGKYVRTMTLGRGRGVGSPREDCESDQEDKVGGWGPYLETYSSLKES